MVSRLLIRIIVAYKKMSTVFRFTRVPILIYTDCKYHPSCSDYAVEAINKHGALRGSAKSIIRIFKCSPFSKGGVDHP